MSKKVKNIINNAYKLTNKDRQKISDIVALPKIGQDMYVAVNSNDEIASTPEGYLIGKYFDFIAEELKLWKMPKEWKVKKVKIIYSD